MPIFDYTCQNCGFKVEDRLTFSYEESIKCPNCGSTANKLPSWANFVIRGYSYKNGYSKKEEGK